MNLIVLGSGTAVPHPERSSAGFWLETASGSLMLDFSASALHRIAQERLDWANLEAVWISHFHLDHCGGLASYLFSTKHAAETQDRIKPLKIFGGKGLKNLLGAFDKANNYDLFKQPFPVEIVEIEHLEKFEVFKGLEAVPLSTPHKEESHAIHLTDGTKTFVYTADTGFTKELGVFARNVDLLLMECSFVKDKPVEWHLELAEAMYLIRYAHPKRAVLTHLYPEWDKIDFKKEVEKFAPMCEVIEAKDGLRLEI